MDTGEPIPTLDVSSDGGQMTVKEFQEYSFSLIIILLASIGTGYLAERIKMPGLLGE